MPAKPSRRLNPIGWSDLPLRRIACLVWLLAITLGCSENPSLYEMVPTDSNSGAIQLPDSWLDGDHEMDLEDEQSDNDPLDLDGDSIDQESTESSDARLNLIGIQGGGGAVVVSYELREVSNPNLAPQSLKVSYRIGSAWKSATLQDEPSLEAGRHTLTWLSHLDEPFSSNITKVELSLYGDGWETEASSDTFEIDNYFHPRQTRVDHPQGIPIEANHPHFAKSPSGQYNAVLWHEGPVLQRKSFLSLYDAEQQTWTEAGEDFPAGISLNLSDQQGNPLQNASEEFCLAVGDESPTVIGLFRALHGEGIQKLLYLEFKVEENQIVPSMAEPIILSTQADITTERNLACARVNGRSVVLHSEQWIQWNDIVAIRVSQENKGWTHEEVHIASGTENAYRSHPRLLVLEDQTLLAAWIEPLGGGLSTVVTLQSLDAWEWTHRQPLLPSALEQSLQDFRLFASAELSPTLALAVQPLGSSFTPRFFQGSLHEALQEVPASTGELSASNSLELAWMKDTTTGRSIWVWMDDEQERLLSAIRADDTEDWSLGFLENYQQNGLRAGGLGFAGPSLSQGLSYWRSQTLDSGRLGFEWVWMPWNEQAATWQAPRPQSEALLSPSESITSQISAYNNTILYLAAIQTNTRDDLLALRQNETGAITTLDARPGYTVLDASSGLPVTQILEDQLVSVFILNTPNGNWPYVSTHPLSDITDEEKPDIPFYTPGLLEQLTGFHVQATQGQQVSAMVVLENGTEYEIKTTSLQRPPTQSPTWTILVQSDDALDLPLFHVNGQNGLAGYWTITEGDRELHLLATSDGGAQWSPFNATLSLPADRLEGSLIVRWSHPLGIGYHLRSEEDEQSLVFMESSLNESNVWEHEQRIAYRHHSGLLQAISLSDRDLWVHAEQEDEQRTRLVLEQKPSGSTQWTTSKGPLLSGTIHKLWGQSASRGSVLELFLWLRDEQENDILLSTRYNAQMEIWEALDTVWQADEDTMLTGFDMSHHESETLLLGVKTCEKGLTEDQIPGNERLFILLRPATATTWSSAQGLLLQGEFDTFYSLRIAPSGQILAPYLKEDPNGYHQAYLRVWP